MVISDADRKRLRDRAGGECSFLDCRVREHLEEAHIVADKPDGPRGDDSIPKSERDAYSNRIILCRNHHAVVDGDPMEWTVEKMKDVKAAHEEDVAQRLRREEPETPVSARAADGSSAQIAGDGATNISQIGQGNVNIGTVNILPANTKADSVPVLEFSDPIPDDTIAMVDAQNDPHTPVRLWRVELRNMADGTEASDVEVALARSIPATKTFPVDLHRFHDNNPPFSQRHIVRNGAPITFDVIAKAKTQDLFFLWRSDLVRPHYTYVYPLSAGERDALLGDIRGDGTTLILRASGKAPVQTKEKAYRVFIDDAEQFMMETVQPDLEARQALAEESAEEVIARLLTLHRMGEGLLTTFDFNGPKAWQDEDLGPDSYTPPHGIDPKAPYQRAEYLHWWKQLFDFLRDHVSDVDADAVTNSRLRPNEQGLSPKWPDDPDGEPNQVYRRIEVVLERLSKVIDRLREVSS